MELPTPDRAPAPERVLQSPIYSASDSDGMEADDYEADRLSDAGRRVLKRPLELTDKGSRVGKNACGGATKKGGQPQKSSAKK